MINYEVGQVVYLLNQKSLKIVPALIVEEITRKTVSDSITEYVIEMPDKNASRVKLSAVSSKIFNDVELLRQHMLDNTRMSVEKLIESAIEMKDSKFGGNFVNKDAPDKKSKEILDVFSSKSDNTTNLNVEASVQNSVKDVIMKVNKNISTNNTQQQEK